MLRLQSISIILAGLFSVEAAAQQSGVAVGNAVASCRPDFFISTIKATEQYDPSRGTPTVVAQLGDTVKCSYKPVLKQCWIEYNKKSLAFTEIFGKEDEVISDAYEVFRLVFKFMQNLHWTYTISNYKSANPSISDIDLDNTSLNLFDVISLSKLDIFSGPSTGKISNENLKKLWENPIVSRKGCDSAISDDAFLSHYKEAIAKARLAVESKRLQNEKELAQRNPEAERNKSLAELNRSLKAELNRSLTEGRQRALNDTDDQHRRSFEVSQAKGRACQVLNRRVEYEIRQRTGIPIGVEVARPRETERDARDISVLLAHSDYQDICRALGLRVPAGLPNLIR